MSVLINRWDAMQEVQRIDYVATLRDGDPVIRMSDVEHVLENLPEPEHTDTNVGDMDDSISRQAALNLFPDDNLYWDTNEGYFAPHYVKTLLRNLPSAQPEQRWIPVSERLPDDLAEVNVTWVNHEPEPYYDFVKDKPFTATAVYYKGDWYWYSSACVDILAEYGKNEIDKLDDAIEITAWMPLPEPYRRGDSE